MTLVGDGVDSQESEGTPMAVTFVVGMSLVQEMEEWESGSRGCRESGLNGEAAIFFGVTSLRWLRTFDTRRTAPRSQG